MLRSLFAVLAVAVVTGCSPNPGASSPKLESINFSIDWDPEPTYLGIYYAKSKGLFEAAGYDVQIVSLRGANAVIQAIAGGQNPIGTASGGATVIGIANGNRTVSLGVLYPRISTVVYGYASENVSKPEDLYGKTVAIYPTSITRNEFDAFMKINKLDPARIRIVDAVGSDLEFLAQKQADAALNYAEMSPARLEVTESVAPVNGKRGFEIALAEHGLVGYGLNIVTSPSELTGHPGRAQALAAAAIEGYRQGCAEREAAVESFLLQVHKVKSRMDAERPYVRASWERVCAFVGATPGAQDAAGWEQTIATYGGLRLLPKAVTPAEAMPAL